MPLVTDATLDDQGRLTLPKELRERYGNRYYVVDLRDGIKLIPVADNPLEALREEFVDVGGTADELRGEARRSTGGGGALNVFASRLDIADVSEE